MAVFCVHFLTALDRGKWCDLSGQAAWTAHHVQNHALLGGSSNQPGGPPCWASLLAFGLIANTQLMKSTYVSKKGKGMSETQFARVPLADFWFVFFA
jgi:hypothetical protein